MRYGYVILLTDIDMDAEFNTAVIISHAVSKLFVDLYRE